MQKASTTRFAGLTLSVLFALMLLVPALRTPRPAAAAPAASPTQILTFAATGHSIRTGAFVQFFQAYGGVATFGYPLAEETTENGRLVQYFERQRFEYHPENGSTDYAVELGRLGDEQSRAEQPFAKVVPFANTPTRQYVAATQHSLAEPFLSYWQAHGGVRILGYPISEPLMENGQQVQYFERARFEYHPENQAPYNVLLSQLGKVSYQQHYGQAPAAPAAPPAARAAALNGLEGQLLNEINGARAAAGLGAVTLDPSLIALTRDRAADMANRNYFAHITPDGKTFLDMLRTRQISFAMGGEIIAQNNYPTAQTADQAYQGFMHSSEHHAIIMMGQWRTVGVGEAVNGAGMYYFSVIFVQPQ